MERRNRRLRVFQSLAQEGSPKSALQDPTKSMQDQSFSYFSQSSTSSMKTEGSFIGDFFPSSNAELLNQTYTEPSPRALPVPNFLKSKLATTAMSVQSLADKYSRATEVKKLENRHDDSLKKPETSKDRILNLSTEDSSKEEQGERGKPKKRPLGESEKRFYVVRLDLIKNGQDSRTTVMIKNIPNKYTQKMLLQTIDKKFRGTYDFLYLPIDFTNRCNVGYAFINFIDFRVIAAFFLEFNEKRWEKFNSEKICAIAYARIQGLKELVKHFQNSSVINQDDNQVRPVILPRH